MASKRPKRTALCATSFLAASYIWLLMAGCSANSHSNVAKNKAEQRSPSAEQKTTPQVNPDPRIDLNCTYGRLQNPPDSFHYVYKKDADDGSSVDQEADFTPQTIDGFRLQPDGSKQAIHATRSDQQGWRNALAGLTGISGMSGTVSTFNNTSAMRRESDTGQVNGYDAIHYSIDTARWDATTRQMLGNFALGPGGSDKGDAWVTADGCPVKLALDDEMHKKDGSLLEKVHYEVSMTKK
ncbi:MAG: hypothetical protein ACRD8A_12175 [Candidatus Acidiferrales bacterium]